MVDPALKPQLRHALVDMRAPSLAPVLQQLGRVPVAVLLPEPVRPHVAHRQHDVRVGLGTAVLRRSEEHTSELQSLMRISYAVFCLKQQKEQTPNNTHN